MHLSSGPSPSPASDPFLLAQAATTLPRREVRRLVFSCESREVLASALELLLAEEGPEELEGWIRLRLDVLRAGDGEIDPRAKKRARPKGEQGVLPLQARTATTTTATALEVEEQPVEVRPEPQPDQPDNDCDGFSLSLDCEGAPSGLDCDLEGFDLLGSVTDVDLPRPARSITQPLPALDTDALTQALRAEVRAYLESARPALAFLLLALRTRWKGSGASGEAHLDLLDAQDIVKLPGSPGPRWLHSRSRVRGRSWSPWTLPYWTEGPGADAAMALGLDVRPRVSRTGLTLTLTVGGAS